MKYYAIGYATNAALPDVTADDAQKLTHMKIAFGLIKDDCWT